MFTLSWTAVFLLALGRVFSWQAAFALLIVPTFLLCRYLRYRAAAIATGVSLLAGTWIVVPPRWSLRVDGEGVSAIVIFACASALTIVLTVKATHRKPSASNA